MKCLESSKQKNPISIQIVCNAVFELDALSLFQVSTVHRNRFGVMGDVLTFSIATYRVGMKSNVEVRCFVVKAWLEYHAEHNIQSHNLTVPLLGVL